MDATLEEQAITAQEWRYQMELQREEREIEYCD